MTPEEIRSSLESAGPSPEVIRAAVEHAEELAPAIIALARKASDGVFLLPKQEQLLFHGLPVLAAARHQPLCRPLLRLLRSRPDVELEQVFGDALTEFVPRVVLSVFDGDFEPLVAAVEDRAAEGLQRWGFLQVLACLAMEAAVPRQAVIDLLDRFDRERMAEPGDAAWKGWQDAIVLMRLPEMADRVRASWADGRNPEREVDQADWEEWLKETCAAPDHRLAIERYGVLRIEDPVEPLRRFLGEESDTEAAELTREQVRLGDPGAGLALDLHEETWLAGFLACSQVPPTTMSLEELDGFFTALVCGPGPVPTSEYLPVIWGTPDGEGPDFDSAEQLEYFMALLGRHWNAISQRLATGFPHVPMLDTPPDDPLRGEQWARGFQRGIGLRSKRWSALRHLEPFERMLLPISVLDQELRERAATEGIDVPERAELIEELPLAVLALYGFWREQERGWDPAAFVALTQQRRKAVKVGRNDLCPCGSGKKYKRCCGA